MKFEKTTLDNGLEVVAEINESALSTALGFFVRSGGRDETDENSGVSHFLEHMVFKGTEKRRALDVNRELDELGGISNAYTSDELTAFYAKVLPELQEPAIELFSDLMRPSLRKEDFDVEKQVVLEEMKMYEDQPPFQVDELGRAKFWSGHPLSRNVLGTRESISNLTVEAMRDYFEKRYSPSNIVFVASGNLDFDDVARKVDECCGGWAPFEAPRPTSRPKGRDGSFVVKRADSSQEYVFQFFDGPCFVDEERVSASLLAQIIGGSGSRMFWKLVDPGLADYAHFSLTTFSDGGFFDVTLACNPEDADDNLAIIREILDEVKKQGATEKELARAKTMSATNCVLEAEKPMDRLFSIGEAWLLHKKYHSIPEILKEINDVALDDLADVMERYPLTNPFTAAIGDLDSLRDY